MIDFRMGLRYALDGDAISRRYMAVRHIEMAHTGNATVYFVRRRGLALTAVVLGYPLLWLVGLGPMFSHDIERRFTAHPPHHTHQQSTHSLSLDNRVPVLLPFICKLSILSLDGYIFYY